MTRLIMTACCVIALVASATVADAKEKRKARHAKAPPAAAKFHQQGPARMIEVSPGRYVSSFGCVTDEGYGRFSPCDLTDGGAR